MRNEDLAAIAGDLNHVPETAAHIARHGPVVLEMNTLIRDAADALVAPCGRGFRAPEGGAARQAFGLNHL